MKTSLVAISVVALDNLFTFPDLNMYMRETIYDVQERHLALWTVCRTKFPPRIPVPESDFNGYLPHPGSPSSFILQIAQHKLTR